MRQLRNVWSIFCVIIIFASLNAQIVQAESQNFDDSFQSWLDEIAKSDDSRVSYNTPKFYPGSNILVVSDLEIQFNKLNMHLIIDAIQFEQPETLVSSSFSIRAEVIKFTNVEFRWGAIHISADNIVLRKAAFPTITPRQIDKTNSFATTLELLENLLILEAAEIHVPHLVVSTLSSTQDKNASKISAQRVYEQNILRNVKNKRIGQWNIQNTLLQIPQREPILREYISSTQLQGINLNSIFDLIRSKQSPTQNEYIISKDGLLPFMENLDYTNYKLEFAGLTIKIAQIQIEDWQFRHASTKLQKQLALVLWHPQVINALNETEWPDFMLNLAALFHLSKLSLNNIELDTLGIRQFLIKEISFKNLSSSRIGQFIIRSFQADLEEIGTLNLANFHLTDLKLPNLNQVLTYIRKEQALSIFELLPSLSGLSISDLNIQIIDYRLGLQKFNTVLISNSDDDIQILELIIENLAVSKSLLPLNITFTDSVIEYMEVLQLDTLHINQALKLKYNNQTKTLNLEQFETQIASFGKLNLIGQFQNLSSSPFFISADIVERLLAMKLASARLVFLNTGLVESGFEIQARKLGSDSATLRNQLRVTLPFLVGILQNPGFQKELVTALQAFLPNPEGLVIELNPNTPTALATLTQQLRRDPRKLIGLLGTSITNSPNVPKPIDNNTP